MFAAACPFVLGHVFFHLDPPVAFSVFAEPMIRRIDMPANMPLPLLITGIAGVPGYNAMAYFSAKYPGQVVGIRQVDNVRLVGPGVVACNAEDRHEVARLFAKYQFAAVLDCAGNCALRQCEVAPELAWRINVEGVRNLLSQTLPRGVRLVHLSCDLVFSGADGRGGYVETDPPTRLPFMARRWWPAKRPSWRPTPGPHFADFSAHGRQFQRSRRGHRLDRLAVQEVSARHAVCRRDPHAHLHRLPQSALRNDAPGELCGIYPRRRAAAVEPLPDRANHQSRRRLRSRLPDGHPAAAKPGRFRLGRETCAWTAGSSLPRWAVIRSTPGPIATRWCLRTGVAPRTSPRRASLTRTTAPRAGQQPEPQGRGRLSGKSMCHSRPRLYAPPSTAEAAVPQQAPGQSMIPNEASSSCLCCERPSIQLERIHSETSRYGGSART